VDPAGRCHCIEISNLIHAPFGCLAVDSSILLKPSGIRDDLFNAFHCLQQGEP
jgi:hypothetical protein